jgi:ribosomal protein S12 methylthiotransferase accessory factor
MIMEMKFPGGLAVEALYKGHRILTDQTPRTGGSGTAPEPFSLFLASIGTCAGFYALRFCQQRSIATDDLKVSLQPIRDPESKRITTVRITLDLPVDFPEKYRSAIVRAVDQCAVKRHIVEPPEFEVVTLQSDQGVEAPDQSTGLSATASA